MDEYQNQLDSPQLSKGLLLKQLMKESVYKAYLQNISKDLQLQELDVNECASGLYDELLRQAHGNTGGLVVKDTENGITEVAATKAVFYTLKAKGCVHLPIKFIIKYISINLRTMFPNLIII